MALVAKPKQEHKTTTIAFIEYALQADTDACVRALDGIKLPSVGPGKLRAYIMKDYMESFVSFLSVLCFCLFVCQGSLCILRVL